MNETKLRLFSYHATLIKIIMFEIIGKNSFNDRSNVKICTHLRYFDLSSEYYFHIWSVIETLLYDPLRNCDWDMFNLASKMLRESTFSDEKYNNKFINYTFDQTQFECGAPSSIIFSKEN